MPGQYGYGGFGGGLAGGIAKSGGLEMIADAIKEQQKAQEQAAGAQILADQALQAKAITPEQYAKFLNSSASQKAAMTGAFLHSIAFQEHQANMESLDQERKARAAELQAKTIPHAMTPEMEAKIQAAGYQPVFTPGKGWENLPYQGGGPDNITFTDANGKQISIPAGSKLAQQIIQKQNPDLVNPNPYHTNALLKGYGLTSADILNSNIQQGFVNGVPLPSDQPWTNATHVQIKAPGTPKEGIMLPMGVFQAFKTQLGVGQPATQQTQTAQQLPPPGPPMPAGAEVRPAIAVDPVAAQRAQAIAYLQSKNLPVVEQNIQHYINNASQSQ